jgi:tetratricopeptide (TPR) repeat protein/tRNA A-37 threonylcarbamoyl transferase component Bud32
MPLAPNQQLFEYRIVGILGQGAFGIVYLAHDTLLDRRVAIKELTITTQTDEVAFKRFIQEARAAGGLNHPHIVTVYALKVIEANVYLVMEYLAGGSLRALLEKRGPLPVEEAVHIAADVCEGLAAAHAKGIVHRDVKPENVLLTEDGRAKIGDFGIARVPQAMGGYTMTRTGFQPGTLPYMSPEQVRGQQVDERSDVYGVGVVLYEMLTGRHYVDAEALERQAQEIAGSNVMLFQARLYELLAEAICEREPEDVCRVRPDVPRWVVEIVAAVLAKRVEERPTAGELARALRSGEAVRFDREAYPDAVDVTPAELEYLTLRGMIHARDGRLDKAIREFQAVLRINPDDAEAHCYLGVAHAQQGQLDEAIREFHAALRINPNYAKAHSYLGLAYYQQARLDEAIREHQAALRINPNLADAHLNLGAAYTQQGRLDEAIREYQVALRINLDYAEAHFNLGLAFVEQGRLDEAIREYQAALRINPDYAEAHHSLGSAYALQGRPDDEIREYQAALRINPNYANAHINLGLAYLQRGCLDDAIREWQAALRINPNLAKVHYNLGMAYEQQARLNEAVHEYQVALRINPDDANAHFILSWAYRKQGRWDEAIREAELALQLGFEPARELLVELKRILGR